MKEEKEKEEEEEEEENFVSRRPSVRNVVSYALTRSFASPRTKRNDFPVWGKPFGP